MDDQFLHRKHVLTVAHMLLYDINDFEKSQLSFLCDMLVVDICRGYIKLC